MARLNRIVSCRATAIMTNTSACNFTRRRYKAFVVDYQYFTKYSVLRFLYFSFIMMRHLNIAGFASVSTGRRSRAPVPTCRNINIRAAISTALSALKKVCNNPENRSLFPTCRNEPRLAGGRLSNKSEQVLREAKGFFSGLRSQFLSQKPQPSAAGNAV